MTQSRRTEPCRISVNLEAGAVGGGLVVRSLGGVRDIANARINDACIFLKKAGLLCRRLIAKERGAQGRARYVGQMNANGLWRLFPCYFFSYYFTEFSSIELFGKPVPCLAISFANLIGLSTFFRNEEWKLK